MLTGLKTLSGLLPRPWRMAAKRWYYPRLFRRFDAARWPGSELVERLLRPGDLVVDAGANIGYVSMLLARWVGPSGCVHSFEPVPETYALLCSNMRALGLANVVPHAVALSDTDGEGAMAVPDYPEGGENFYEARLADPAPGHARVAVRRLDTALAGESRPIRFMKIDVEGHEGRVVTGAAGRLGRDRPALYIEMSSMPDEPGAGRVVHEALIALGYAPFLLSGGGPRPWSPGDRAVDLFYLTPENRARLAP